MVVTSAAELVRRRDKPVDTTQSAAQPHPEHPMSKSSLFVVLALISVATPAFAYSRGSTPTQTTATRATGTTYTYGGSGTYDASDDFSGDLCSSVQSSCRTFCQAQYDQSSHTQTDALGMYDCYTGCEEGYGSCLDFYR
jgi:hypothetical protein